MVSADNCSLYKEVSVNIAKSGKADIFPFRFIRSNARKHFLSLFFC